MYINKLYLRAFGKFTYKKMYLGRKLNIIYGENETGKSTIHNFIEAALYGFDDNQTGEELYKKYKPWDSDLYKGSLSVDGVNGKRYVVSRDFLFGTTQLTDKESEDNASLPEEAVKCPGEYFFSMNKVSFKNTVSIKQLGNKTDKELSQEIKNKIINLSSTRDESISISRILSSLQSVKDEAGSEDNPKTLLGQYALRLKELEITKENSLNAARQVMFLAMEKKKIKSKISEIEMSSLSLANELKTYELSKEKNRYLKAEPVKKELDEVTGLLLQYDGSELEKHSKTEYEEALRINSYLNRMKNERHGLAGKRDEASEQLHALQEDMSNRIPSDFSIENVNERFMEYEKNKSKIKELEGQIKIGTESLDSCNLDELMQFIENYNAAEEAGAKSDILKALLNEKNYEAMKSLAKSNSIKSFLIILAGTVLVGAGAAAGYAAYYYSMPEYYWGTAASALGLIFYMLSGKTRRKTLNAKKEMESIECQNADYNKKLEVLDKELEELFNVLGCSDAEELKGMYESKKIQKNIADEKLRLLEYDKDRLNDLKEESKIAESALINSFMIFSMDEINEDNLNTINEVFGRKDSVKASIEVLKASIEELNHDIGKMDRDISYEEKRLVLILSSNEMSSVEQFKEHAERYEEFLDLKNRKEYCEKLLDTILGSTDFYELKAKTEKFNLYDVREIDENQQQISIFRLNEDKIKLHNSISNIEKEISEIENQVRNLAEIEEEIEFYEDKKRIFNEKILTADIAAEKIAEIADSIKGDFMPMLRKTISENFAYVTGGRYKEVFIDEDLNISVVSEDNRDVEIESLSAGTLDQLYLSLRIGLGSILSGNQNIPIILDDSFVQYDSNRLKKSIEMLSRESERRQIILFTCQDREIEYAKQLNVKFNLIKL